MNAEDVKQKLIDALGEHKELWEWIHRLDSGVGTYDDVGKIAELIGDQIAQDVASEYSEDLLRAYLEAGHSLVSEFGIVAQQNLNDAAHIGIAPLTTKTPNASIQTLVEEIALIAPEAVPDEIRNSVPSFVMGYVDAIVKYNADFQAKAGLNPVIVRTWSGSYPSHDTRHTDWCHDLAGTYDYGSEPKSVYVRHKGCRCKVEYFPDKNSKGRITALAKGEIDREGVLWNTRSDTLEKRIRKQQRQK